MRRGDRCIVGPIVCGCVGVHPSRAIHVGCTLHMQEDSTQVARVQVVLSERVCVFPSTECGSVELSRMWSDIGYHMCAELDCL